MDKVSVIMPCYNDGKYIQEAIASVFNQTYNNVELIIIDDGSDDIETKKILRSIDDNRIKIFNTNRLRPAGARNYGIEHAEGKYILPLDADDYIDSTYIEKSLKILQENVEVGIVYCEANLFGEKKGRWDLPEYSFDKMLLDNIVFVTSMFYKKDWEVVGGFNTYMEAGMEDYDFWLSILSLGKKIYQIPEVLFYYRIKKKSRTTEFMDNSEQVKNIYNKIYDNHKNFYDKYAEQYAKILREALIEQTFLSRKYERQISIVKKYQDIPILGWTLKRFLGKDVL